MGDRNWKSGGGNPLKGLPYLLPQVSMKAARDPTAQPQQEASQVLGALAGRKTSSSVSSAPLLIFMRRRRRWGDEAEERGGQWIGGCEMCLY